jgi:DHA2 family methylenomycin A resistance protein-like MFS transporter
VFSLLFQTVQGRSALSAGLAFLPMTASIMAANLVSGPVTRRFGSRAAILAGQVMMAGACAALLGVGGGTAYWAMAAQLLVLGGGLGLVVPPLTSALLGSVERSRSGVASGALFALRQSGSVIGVALFGSLIARRFVGGLHAALAVSIAVLAAGGVASLAVAPDS